MAAETVPAARRDECPRRLSGAEIGPATALLGRGFRDDPLFSFLVPDPAARARLLPRLLSSLVRYAVRYGEVHALAAKAQSATGLDGVAVWLPPSGTTMTPGRMLRSGVLTAPLRLGRRGLPRFGAFIRATEAAHAAAAPLPHWYLLLLAVEPERRGHGLGTDLLWPTLAAADRAALPVYLETMQPASIPFYERLGFAIVHEGVIPNGGPPFWGLRRPPLG